MKLTLLNRALDARQRGRSLALVTDLRDGQQTLVFDDEPIHGDAAPPTEALAAIRERLADDRSGMVGEHWFVKVMASAPRVILVGAVHIAQALAPMAALAGYAVTVVDPRRAFATDARFPGLSLSDDWPDEALDKLAPDGRTAVVTLTHDPKLDDPALIRALASPAFYVGALGSRKTHAARLDRLRAEGVEEAALTRIHGPVGIDIGALTQAEIAISIMAQITQRRRQPHAG
jgi:xanthine dehydrogenase accessory factor